MGGESVSERLSKWTDQELLRIVGDDSLYRSKVLEFAMRELKKRGMKLTAGDYKVKTVDGEEFTSLSAGAVKALYKERRIDEDTLVWHPTTPPQWLKLADIFDARGWDEDRLKLARQVRTDDLDYRRKHRWDIFSWASSLLLGGSGGLFTISRLTSPAAVTPNPHLTYQKLALGGAIIVLTGYAILWLWYHYEREELAEKRISSINEVLLAGVEKKASEPSEKLRLLSRIKSEVIALIVLGVFALVVLYFT